METGLSLGTNQGDRIALLREARQRIAALPGITEKGKSPVYETQPVDVAPEHAHLSFYNAVLIIDCCAPPEDLIKRIQEIEAQMGRVRNGLPNQPRPIDIDILYVGEVVIKDAHLCIPHPRWAQRTFVVRPLSDVRPNLVIPGTTKPVKQLLHDLPDADEPHLVTYSW
jgi:2-amino-4-hydroxy-6-hydroxymethyldihydropteridine diphosphokinase